MAEQRLIDANKIKPVHVGYYGKVVDWATIEYAATIDPETLPIVQQLRGELARVTAEKDASIKDLYMTKDCNTCALQFTDECLLEDCMEPCCNFWRWYVPYKWRGLQKEEP